eukprot:TRINITY_DN16_c1_g1_i1.p1 TRINITY_DN16_c1_g1~~TRINITY_DN16_c1_g1_i1.p1  ORF type:complete len:444 (+),score=175.93 TRINITY_DN16_c1_g1_i1:54-1385(+)
MASSTNERKTRDEYKKQKALEEARKNGTAPLQTDEEGKEINPHIPQYIANAPWYLKSQVPSLKHQRDFIPKIDYTKDWYARGIRISNNSNSNNSNNSNNNNEKVTIQVLRQLLNKSKSSFELIPLQDGTLPEFYTVLKEIKEKNFVQENETTGELTLTNLGKDFVNKLTSSISNLNCHNCKGRGYTINSNAEFVNLYKKVLENRPPPSQDYNQQFITPENIIARVAFMDERGDVAGKDILVIGDDDMISIALALTRLPRRVVVLEVDTRVNSFVNSIAKEYNLNIEAYNFDVRLAFPNEFKRAFDVFTCDPVETFEGIKLFLSAGAGALRGENSSLYFGLTTLEAGTKKWYKIQLVLQQMNFVTTDIKRNFNEYECTEFDNTFTVEQKLGVNSKAHMWYWSALWRNEAISQPLPIINLDGSHIVKDIYLDDETWATPTTVTNS